MPQGDANWTTDEPEVDHTYWLTKRWADGTYSDPTRMRFVNYGTDADGLCSMWHWPRLVRDYHMRSVLPIVPPPLPETK